MVAPRAVGEALGMPRADTRGVEVAGVSNWASRLSSCRSSSHLLRVGFLCCCFGGIEGLVTAAGVWVGCPKIEAAEGRLGVLSANLIVAGEMAWRRSAKSSSLIVSPELICIVARKYDQHFSDDR